MRNSRIAEVTMRRGVVRGRLPPPSVPIVTSTSLYQPDTTEPLGPSGFPDRLRGLREAADISLREQDRLAGLTLGHSQAIDRRKISGGIEIHVVARLARAYGSTIDWLYMGHGQPPTEEAREVALDRADQICRREEEYRAKIRKI